MLRYESVEEVAQQNKVKHGRLVHLDNYNDRLIARIAGEGCNVVTGANLSDRRDEAGKFEITCRRVQLVSPSGKSATSPRLAST